MGRGGGLGIKNSRIRFLLLLIFLPTRKRRDNEEGGCNWQRRDKPGQKMKEKQGWQAAAGLQFFHVMCFSDIQDTDHTMSVKVAQILNSLLS